MRLGLGRFGVECPLRKTLVRRVGMSIIRKHLFAILAVIPLLPYLFRGIVWLLDWQGRIETVISDFRDGKFGGIIEFLLNRPPWTIWVALACGFGLFGIDYYRNTRHHRVTKHYPIIPTLQWESPRLLGASDAQAATLWNNIFYLVLRNQDPNRTIRNVSVQINAFESIERCPVKGTGLFAFDLRHGDHVYYRLGRVISSEFCGLPGSGLADDPISKEQMDEYQQRVKTGSISFEPSGTGIKFSGRLDEAGMATKWTFPVGIIGDGMPQKIISFSVDMRDKKISGSIDPGAPPQGVSYENQDGTAAHF
jgi:hypothetical protein